MHGLVFKTSISLLAGSTRYLIVYIYTMLTCHHSFIGMATFIYVTAKHQAWHICIQSAVSFALSISLGSALPQHHRAHASVHSRAVHAARLFSASCLVKNGIGPSRAASPLGTLHCRFDWSRLVPLSPMNGRAYAGRWRPRATRPNVCPENVYNIYLSIGSDIYYPNKTILNLYII